MNEDELKRINGIILPIIWILQISTAIACIIISIVLLVQGDLFLSVANTFYDIAIYVISATVCIMIVDLMAVLTIKKKTRK